MSEKMNERSPQREVPDSGASLSDTHTAPIPLSAEDVGDYIRRARDGRLTPEEVRLGSRRRPRVDDWGIDVPSENMPND